MVLYVKTMQGAVRLFIQVEDYDPIGSNDHIDDVYVTIMLTPNSSFNSRTAYVGITENSRIELSFRLQCTNSFYGSNCTTFCMPRNDSEGRYECGPDGERICLSGWSDPSRNCTVCKLILCMRGACSETSYNHLELHLAMLMHTNGQH